MGLGGRGYVKLKAGGKRKFPELNQTGQPSPKQKCKELKPPKKPKTAYNFFQLCAQRNITSTASSKIMHSQGVARNIGLWWRKLTNLEKSTYQQMAREDRVRYERECTEYLNSLRKELKPSGSKPTKGERHQELKQQRTALEYQHPTALAKGLPLTENLQINQWAAYLPRQVQTLAPLPVQQTIHSTAMLYPSMNPHALYRQMQPSVQAPLQHKSIQAQRHVAMYAQQQHYVHPAINATAPRSISSMQPTAQQFVQRPQMPFHRDIYLPSDPRMNLMAAIRQKLQAQADAKFPPLTNQGTVETKKKLGGREMEPISAKQLSESVTRSPSSEFLRSFLA